MRALRRVPARFFGVFMSINPEFAALTGLIVLGQSLELADWLAVAAIVTANAVSVSTGGQARSRPAQGQPGRSMPMMRRPASLASRRTQAGSSLLPGPPWPHNPAVASAMP